MVHFIHNFIEECQHKHPLISEYVNSNEDPSLPEPPNNKQVDSFRDSESDSEEEVDSTLETMMSMICPTRLGRVLKNTHKSDGRFPAGRNDRNVRW